MTSARTATVNFAYLREMPTAPLGLDGSGVVLSRIVRGTMASRAYRGATIKYVARGAETYHYGGRSFRVTDGRFLVVPAGLAGDVAIRPEHADGTLGLCLLLAGSAAVSFTAAIDRPMLFSDRCSQLGMALRDALAGMADEAPRAPQLAADLLLRAGDALEDLAIESIGQLDRIDTVRDATRHEVLRRLAVARAHLHENLDRAIPLTELATVAGMSRFQLVRYFGDVFAASPIRYHRRLRLERAAGDVRGGVRSVAAAAQAWGFADASTLSHAYRRAFGTTVAGRG